MPLKKTTPIPNIIFDHFLKILKPSDLKVLLIIIRQTLGWFDRGTGRRKTRDWISRSQFVSKTGLSPRAITTALSSLHQKGIIAITNKQGVPLPTPQMRQGLVKMYFGLRIEHLQKLPETSAKRHIEHLQNLQITKETLTKEMSTK
ncbi:MAG: replication protein [Bacteroidota bacterium]